MKCIPLSFQISLYEIWWNWYLSQSWRSVFAWREHLYIICVFPMVLMEELDLKWEVSAGCCFSWIILATTALKGDGTNIRATRTRAAFKLRLPPGSMMSAIPLEAGARVWGVKNRSLEGGFSILVRNGIASWRVGASLLSWSCFFSVVCTFIQWQWQSHT